MNIIFNYLDWKFEDKDLSQKVFLESYNFLGFHRYITIEISGQSYTTKTVLMSKTSLICDMEGVFHN